MKKILLLLLVLLLLVNGCGFTANQNDKEIAFLEYSKKFPEFAVKDDNVQNAQPAIFYAYANYLYGQDEKDEAVFWFYLGQFRVRFVDQVQKKNLPIDSMLFIRFFRESGFVGNVSVVDQNGEIVVSQSSDPAYSKYNSVYSGATYDNIYKAGYGLGEIINPYAFQDLDKQIARIDSVIKYEKEHPINLQNVVAEGNLLSEEKINTIKEEEFKKLENFKQYIIDNKEEIKKRRAENGLPND